MRSGSCRDLLERLRPRCGRLSRGSAVAIAGMARILGIRSFSVRVPCNDQFCGQFNCDAGGGEAGKELYRERAFQRVSQAKCRSRSFRRSSSHRSSASQGPHEKCGLARSGSPGRALFSGDAGLSSQDDTPLTLPGASACPIVTWDQIPCSTCVALTAADARFSTPSFT